MDEKPEMKMPSAAADHVGIRVDGAEGRVEGPARIDAAAEQRVERDDAAEHEDVPTRQIELGKGQVLRADHHRDQEIAERVRDRGNQEEPDHDDAVHREQLVVGVRR